MENRITTLFGIRYPIIAGGMIWCSGWRLAAAVSDAGGLGLIGAGSMTPDLLREHIRKCRAATGKPFGVNVPLMYRYAEQIMQVVMEERVPAVFTSAGSPKTWTGQLHAAGCKVAHVVSSTKFALKCQEAGVDAVVAEGFEAGGHNGREETATMALVPQVRAAITIPLIAAGGIATGRGMLAAFALGAEGIQMGTRFALSEESSASDAFKRLCIGLEEGGTMLALKKIGPTRLIRNDFYTAVETAENRGASAEELKELLGRGRSKRGIFEGNLADGELEIGQIMEILPHRQPFLLIDTIEELEPGKRAVGKKCVSYNEPYFAGHFPAEPVMPGVLIVEALAQVGAVAILGCDEFKGKTAYFGAINSAKFKRKVVPGDVLMLETTMIKQKGPIGVASAKATVDGKVAVIAELTFAIG